MTFRFGYSPAAESVIIESATRFPYLLGHLGNLSLHLPSLTWFHQFSAVSLNSFTASGTVMASASGFSLFFERISIKFFMDCLFPRAPLFRDNQRTLLQLSESSSTK